jgi:hypothetical protein
MGPIYIEIYTIHLKEAIVILAHELGHLRDGDINKQDYLKDATKYEKRASDWAIETLEKLGFEYVHYAWLNYESSITGGNYPGKERHIRKPKKQTVTA